MFGILSPSLTCFYSRDFLVEHSNSQKPTTFPLTDQANSKNPLQLAQGWKANLKYDLPAGVVVFLVALPLCLGIALASGAPLFSGIIAGFIGGIVVGSLSGSEISVSGPAAGLAVIVAQAITDLGAFDIFLVAVILSGVFQILLGVLKLGVVGDYVPNSVIKGMLAAIGIVIFLKQIPHALGRDTDYQGDLDFFQQMDGENTFTEIIQAVYSASWEAVVISLVSLGILLLWERPFIKNKSWSTYLPGPLMVVFLGISLNELFRFTEVGYLSATEGHLVQLPKATTWGELATLSVFPDISAFLNPGVYLVGLTIAIVGSLETLLSIEASDKLDPFKRISNTNRELLAQGTGNIISGLIGGLPITSVIVRSSTNVYSGGRTRSSAIIHGVILLVSALAIPFVLNLIPLASLAAILLVIGYKLARISLFSSMFKAGDAQFIPFIVTVLTIVFTDLLTGIVVGLLVGYYYIVRNNYHESIITVFEGENYLIRFTKDMSFVHKITLKKHLRNIPDNSSVVIDGTKSMFIDDDIFEVVQDFKENATFRGVQIQCINFDTKKIPKKNKLIK